MTKNIINGMVKNKTLDRIAELRKLIHKAMQQKTVDAELVKEYLEELKELEEKQTPTSEYLEYSKNPSKPL